MESVSVGEIVYVAIDSWAGRSLHCVRVDKVCRKRALVTWLNETAFRHRQGEQYYVPLGCLVRPKIHGH